MLTSHRLARLAKAIGHYCINSGEIERVGALDSQRANKKTIFGSGFLTTDRIAAELRAADELRAAEQRVEWTLSGEK